MRAVRRRPCPHPRPPRAGHRGRPQPAAATRPHGFTMVELVMVMLLLAILGAVAVPRMTASRGVADLAWRDQVVAALRHARATAEGHRRLVCATLATGEVRLTIAAANPATACGSTFAGPDGDARWARHDGGLALTVSPAGTLYFQPDGRVTSDGAGSTPVSVTVAISGLADIAVVGETGHVD